MLAAGCSVPPEQIPGEYVSADRYRLYSCDQVERESARINARAGEIAAVLEQYAQSDPPRNGLTYWPEYARLKGERAALHQAALRRQCSVVSRVRTDAPMPAMQVPP
jgi:hypothetical protein